MKRLFAILIAAALVLSLAACSGSGSSGKSDPTAAETTLTAELTEAATEEPAQTEADDAALIEETQKQLVGNWSYTGMEDILRLTFNEDGTGSYTGLDGASFTFTYTITPVHKEYGNGKPYIDKTMTVNYDNGETEDIVIDFLDGNLTFHTTDGGGYSGKMTDYGAWIRIS